MNCLSNERLQDYLDGQLSPEIACAVERHLAVCAKCKHALAQEQGLLELLRDLPVPPATPGFFGRALRGARSRHRHRPAMLTGILSGAVAAAVVLGLAALLGKGPNQNGLPDLTLTVGEVREVNLVFNVPRDLEGAILVMELPEQLEIEGFPGRRTLSWQTSLSAGENLLSLPLLAKEAKRGELTARIAYGEAEKIFRLNVDVRRQGRLGKTI